MPSINENDRNILLKIWNLRHPVQIEQAKEQFDDLMGKCGYRSNRNFNEMKDQLSKSSWSEKKLQI
jgi:hypothetical protein